MATRKTTAKKAAKKAVKKAPAKKTVKKAARKVAKKATATKRSYTRKPKAEEVNIPMPPVEDGVEVGSNYQEETTSTSGETMQLIDLDSYSLYDLRSFTNLGKALFLLELETQGYGIKSQDLLPPSQTNTLRSEFLTELELVRLDQNHKAMTFTTFNKLSAADGLIATPTHFKAGLELYGVDAGMAPPNEVNILGERFIRVR